MLSQRHTYRPELEVYSKLIIVNHSVFCVNIMSDENLVFFSFSDQILNQRNPLRVTRKIGRRIQLKSLMIKKYIYIYINKENEQAH